MRILAILVLALASGCTAPSFLAHQGRVTPKGDVRVSLGSGYHVNTQAADVVRDGRDLARTLRAKARGCPAGEGSCWTQEDVDPVVDAALRFALVAPLATRSDVAVRYGVASGVDVGVSVGAGAKGLDVGWQAFGPRSASEPGWAGSLVAGVGTRSLGAFGDVIEGVLHGDAGLTDGQLAFVTGRQWGEFAHTYVGARYTLTRWKLQVIPDLPIIYDGSEVQQRLLGSDASGFLHTYGSVFGAAVGYRHVFIGGELNVLATSGHARVLFRERDLSGVGLMPALYAYAQF